MARLVFGVLIAVFAALACAQDYPARPVRIVVPLPPGGISDNVARVLAARLAERTRQAFVVDNRSGANGVLGTEFVAKAAPDG